VRYEADPPRWLRRFTLIGLAVVLVGLAALAAAIAVGWNNPRPSTAPDRVWSGPVVLQVEAPEEQGVLLLGDVAAPFTLEAVATPQEGSDFNGYGLIFHAEQARRYEIFAVGSDGYVAVLRVEEEGEFPLVDWRPFPHVRRGRASNRIRLSCGEGACRFWVNDEFVTSLPDERGTGRGVGCWVRRFEGGAVAVVFADVAIWESGR